MRAKILIRRLIVLCMFGVGIVTLPSTLNHVLSTASSLTSIETSTERGFTREAAEAKMGRRVRVVNCSSLSSIGKRRDDPDGGWAATPNLASSRHSRFAKCPRASTQLAGFDLVR